MNRLTHLSLFSGIGGADLAAEWAGFESIAFCEQDIFCQKVLKKHWPDVPIYDDIKTFNATQYKPTVLSGGFPCQPFSEAGKQKRKEDDRYLWPEMLRVIKECRPTWVVGENVFGILRHESVEEILSSLEDSYEVQAIILPATSVNLRHRRYRVFILAHTRCTYGRRVLDTDFIKETGPGFTLATSGSVANDEYGYDSENGWTYSGINIGDRCDSFEPKLLRSINGISKRLDIARRHHALGNAIVPQQIYPIFKAIAEIERGIISNVAF